MAVQLKFIPVDPAKVEGSIFELYQVAVKNLALPGMGEVQIIIDVELLGFAFKTDIKFSPFELAKSFVTLLVKFPWERFLAGVKEFLSKTVGAVTTAVANEIDTFFGKAEDHLSLGALASDKKWEVAKWEDAVRARLGFKPERLASQDTPEEKLIVNMFTKQRIRGAWGNNLRAIAKLERTEVIEPCAM